METQKVISSTLSLVSPLSREENIKPIAWCAAVIGLVALDRKHVKRELKTLFEYVAVPLNFLDRSGWSRSYNKRLKQGC